MNVDHPQKSFFCSRTSCSLFSHPLSSSELVGSKLLVWTHLAEKMRRMYAVEEEAEEEERVKKRGNKKQYSMIITSAIDILTLKKKKTNKQIICISTFGQLIQKKKKNSKRDTVERQESSSVGVELRLFRLQVLLMQNSSPHRSSMSQTVFSFKAHPSYFFSLGSC